MPFELYDLIPSRRRTGKTHRRLNHLSAGATEPYAFGTGNHRADKLRGLVFELTLATIKYALVELPANRFENYIRTMAKDHRPHSQIIIDEPITIDVVKESAFGPFKDERAWRHA